MSLFKFFIDNDNVELFDDERRPYQPPRSLWTDLAIYACIALFVGFAANKAHAEDADLQAIVCAATHGILAKAHDSDLHEEQGMFWMRWAANMYPKTAADEVTGEEVVVFLANNAARKTSMALLNGELDEDAIFLKANECYNKRSKIVEQLGSLWK